MTKSIFGDFPSRNSQRVNWSPKYSKWKQASVETPPVSPQVRRKKVK